MKSGEIFEVIYPFCKTKFKKWDEDGEYIIDSWKPGCNAEQYDEGGAEWYADGVGAMIIEVISTHKPGKYPERVFYLRRWRDPEGVEFGKPCLRITTTANLKRLAKGFRYRFNTEDGDYIPGVGVKR